MFLLYICMEYEKYKSEKNILEEERDGPVVRVFPAPCKMIINPLSSLKYFYRIIPFCAASLSGMGG